MLVLSVSAKVYFALKAFPAQVTGERFETCVLAAVCDEVGALTERFAADLALVWLFTCVNVSMFLHVGLLVETLAAELTGVRSSVRVDKQMGRQGRGALKRLSTHFALKAPFL